MVSFVRKGRGAEALPKLFGILQKKIFLVYFLAGANVLNSEQLFGVRYLGLPPLIQYFCKPFPFP